MRVKPLLKVLTFHCLTSHAERVMRECQRSDLKDHISCPVHLYKDWLRCDNHLDMGIIDHTFSLSLKADTMLRSFINLKSDRNSCVKNERDVEREAPGQLLYKLLGIV